MLQVNHHPKESTCEQEKENEEEAAPREEQPMDREATMALEVIFFTATGSDEIAA